jgi:hypothetical protein
VQRRNNVSRISIASPGDFSLLKTPQKGEGAAFPYCFDFLRRRALYVRAGDAQAVQNAPFYYLHLRRTAEHVLSLPLEYGALSPAPAFPDPVFLFSPGRVGSTLISRVLAQAGMASVSEPDFYTQLAQPLWRTAINPLCKPLRQALWSLSQDLCAALGAAPVVKLRAECARAPALFVRSRQTKTLMLFRGFESWSRSTAKVFGAGPQKAVGKYLTALRCYEALARTSNCHLMRYEDWVEAPEAAASALAGFLGTTLAPEAVRRALANPSQEGTPLAGRERPDWHAKWQGALALWHSPRLKAVREALEMPAIWD